MQVWDFFDSDFLDYLDLVDECVITRDSFELVVEPVKPDDAIEVVDCEAAAISISRQLEYSTNNANYSKLA